MTLAHFNYSEKEVRSLYKNMVILVDTREQENGHILHYFTQKEVVFAQKKLDFGDYSFLIKAMPDLGISRDMHFSKTIVIERKASLEELSKNLAQERTAFENELMRAREAGADFTVMVENGTMADIVSHNYKTQFTPEAYWGTVLSFEQKYGIKWAWNMKRVAGEFIYKKFCYFLLEKLK